MHMVNKKQLEIICFPVVFLMSHALTKQLMFFDYLHYFWQKQFVFSLKIFLLTILPAITTFADSF